MFRFVSDVIIFTGKSADVNGVCVRTFWPLTYDDGENVRFKSCELGTAYYICNVEGKALKFKQL